MSSKPRGNRLRLAPDEDAPGQRADVSLVESVERQTTPQPTPLLLDVNALSVALSRSVASLNRDDCAGRLPAALRIGGSKRWRTADVALWVELGCPPRAEFEARRTRR